MSKREDEWLVETADGEPINTELNMEMMRLQHEAQDKNVLVNGWQIGIEDIPDFAVVTDKTTGATFAVKPGEPLAEALDRIQTRMTENPMTKHRAGRFGDKLEKYKQSTSERIRIMTSKTQVPE